MNLPDLIRQLNAKGRHPKWRAKCPAHKSRGLTLGIYADKGGSIGMHCHAGCLKDDVLAAMGLTWKDLKPEREWVSPQAFREMQIKAKAEEESRVRAKRQTAYWIDEVRKWEAAAALLFAHVVRGQHGELASPLWHRAIDTARQRHQRLLEYWPKAPVVEVYMRVRVPKYLTAAFVGKEMAEVLGL